MGAGFEANLPQARPRSLHDEPVEDCGCDAAATPLAPHIHAFDFGEFWTDGNAATADRDLIAARDEKPDIGVEYRIKPQSVTLVGRIKLAQPAHIGGCR